MSGYQEGAIIHIIYEILKRRSKEQEYFSPSEIVEEYKKLKEDACIKEITEKFRKQGKGDCIKTLLDKNELGKWLAKHTDHKEIKWFIRNNRGFKLKEEHINRLKKSREELENCN